MIRVLMITASAGHGGGPQHIYDLAKSLRGQACVDIACPRQEPFYTRFADVIDGDLFEIPERRFAFSDAVRLLAFARKKGASLIHSHGKGAGTYGRFISLVSKLPLVHTPHGIHVDHYGNLMRLVYLSYERLTGWINSKTIYVSPSEYERALKLKVGKKSRSCVILNGVTSQNANDWQQEVRMRIRRELCMGENDVVVVSLSRFDYAKNMLELISVAGELPQIKFLLLGDGPDFTQVKMSAAKLTTNNVFLPGFVNNPIDYLAAADLYISTSRWEGLPLAILQAMSLSLPVVASKVTGNCDAVMEGESGYLYELGNIQEAARYINILAADAKFRRQLGARGRMRQQDEFSLSNMSLKTLAVYKTVLRDKQINARQ
jgi:glycosyltransferase involved in cell wall biosynthesis